VTREEKKAKKKTGYLSIVGSKKAAEIEIIISVDLTIHM